MVRFHLFGIPIEIQPFFWVTLSIIGGALGASSSEVALQVALFVLAGAVSILVHELGHAMTIRVFGAQPHIVLHAFGGYAAYPAGMFGRGRQFVVSAAGPTLQLALAGIAMLLLMFVPLPTAYSRMFFFLLMSISVFWAVLNLVPVIPLDGGQMLAAALGNHRRSIALRISMVTALVAAVVAFATYGGILFPIFLGMFAWQNYQELRHFR